MAFVAFLGCDGSGKSAVIAGVSERLRAAGGKVSTGHWRPQALDAGHGDGARVAADDPHGQAPRGAFLSVLKLGWLWLNWWLGWWRGLRCAGRTGAVLFDRYHGDLCVDPRRYRYGGPLVLARLASRFMPQPDRVFFLDAEPEVLLSRKQEVGREALKRSREAYLRLVRTHPRFRIVDASRPLAEVVDEVMSELECLKDS